MKPARPHAERPHRLASELHELARGTGRAHITLRHRLSYLFVLTLVVDLIGTLLMFHFEHAHPRSGFDDVGGALFWTTAQLTTVSSQLPNPVTTGGRIVDIFLEVWAISIVATLAGALAQFFRARHDERAASES